LVKLLFKELVKEYFHNRDARVQKLQKWINDANEAKDKLEKRANQYYKAEELITFYTFAPLLQKNDLKLVNDILKLAQINEQAIGNVVLSLEKPIFSPKGYLSWLREEVLKINAVSYMREQAIIHLELNKTLETATHVDVEIKTDNLVIFVEMKFTSDISINTTFNPYRNQLARLIDVGIEIAKEEKKKIIVLLASPSEFFQNKSRFYYYKIQDYSNFSEIKKDIVWRKQEEIEKYVMAVKWIPLEELIKTLYRDFNHDDKEEAMAFFKERNLI